MTGTIGKITTTVVRRPYRRAFRISSGNSPTLVTLLVRLEIDGAGGLAGVGEASPMTAYTGATIEGVRACVEQHLAPAVTGHRLEDIRGLHARMDAAVRGQRLAKAAVDIAAHDALGRMLATPVATLLGGRGGVDVPAAGVVGLGETGEVVGEARALVEAGVRHVKVKGGEDPPRDLALIRSLAGELGTGVELALDANGGYRLPEALPSLRRMADAGLGVLEQPLPAWDVDGMARLTAELDLVVLADESVQDVHSAYDLARRRACHALNVKVGKVGGLQPARAIIDLAAAAGLGVKVGSMPELGIATLAAAHLVAATGSARIPPDLVGPAMVEHDVVVSPDLTTASPSVAVPDSPGLGATLDPGVEQLLRGGS